MSGTFLNLIDVTKRYDGVTALNNVCFSADKSSIHAILGENGAGKSTLMKILSGVVRADSGVIELDGCPLDLTAPVEALKHGIVCVFQELSLIPDMTVAENICLAQPPKYLCGLIDKRSQVQIAQNALSEIGCADIDVRVRCETLPISKQQIVEIAKALVRRPRVLILDEATSALTASDVGPLMDLLRRLRDSGTCVLFISHRMREIEALADRCSIFRNGEHVETFRPGSKSHDEVVQLMIGKPLVQVYPEKPLCGQRDVPYLEVAGLAWSTVLKGVDFSVRPGEIVGLGGLDGQGQREILLAVAGVLRGTQGDVRIGGESVLPNGPKKAKMSQYGVAMTPADRKTEGLFLGMSIRDNLTIAALDRISPKFVIDRRGENMLIDSLISRLQLKATNPNLPVATLSGGNQQKVVIAKWLATDPRLLLLMDPTRGIDIGTKQEIYRLFRDLALNGLGILFYSTDHDELIGLCDRVDVVYDGRVIAELGSNNH